MRKKLLISLSLIPCLMSGNFKPPPKQSSVKLDSFIYDSPDVGLMKALQHYHIHHQKIVYAQAILETGYFTSDVYKRHNNLFGLYNSKSHSYYHFNNWYESVDAYGRYIQYRYNGKGYYKFLKRIKYSESDDYIKQIKRIKKKIK